MPFPACSFIILVFAVHGNLVQSWLPSVISKSLLSSRSLSILIEKCVAIYLYFHVRLIQSYLLFRFEVSVLQELSLIFLQVVVLLFRLMFFYIHQFIHLFTSWLYICDSFMIHGYAMTTVIPKSWKDIHDSSMKRHDGFYNCLSIRYSVRGHQYVLMSKHLAGYR